MVKQRMWTRTALLILLAALVGPLPERVDAQAWDATRYFRYNIENVVATRATPSNWTIRVIFSVTDPTTTPPVAWNINTALPFQTVGATLTLDIAWDPSNEFTNTGSANPALAPVVGTALGVGAAIPVQVRNLHLGGSSPCLNNQDCPGIKDLTNRYWVAKTVTPVFAFGKTVIAGRVAIEGRPVCNGVAGCPAVAPFPIIPVKSATANFAFTSAGAATAIIPTPRRPVVDIARCKQCHDGNQHGDTVVPRLSLHGGNRNENLGLCMMCHNPNQTDVPFRFASTTDPRIGGPEVPVDFKTMIHSIHAGRFRKTPFVVVGFNSSVNDFSGVRFPSSLRNCLNCHLEIGGKGTFELPLKPQVLGTTISTGSIYNVPAGSARTINVDPANDVKISPTAAVCSSCHDGSDARAHMVRTGGASFNTTQQAIGVTVRERCASCHGQGMKEDVRKVHEIDGTD